ncbi:MAG: protein translocase subunit SecD, partial [Planctomycetia bacterium]
GNHYVLLVVDTYDVTGRYLTRVEPTVHQGKPGISFSFDAKGASKFYRLTSDYQKEPDGYKHMLGVVLDNRLRSAPTLDERISGNGVISGSFTQVEVEALKKILTAGQLPYALNKEPETQFQIGPTLGRDTINSGLFCIALSLASVLAFIVYYYRVAGMVAVVALLMNLLFTIALLVLFKATWTLPGLAGLVLTVGMSVDANVLIFERIREELENGGTLKAALRTGYEKAWTTIFDSNLTTVITALVLYAIGTDQVKGFAITLIIGLATGIFCAVSVTRVIFNFLDERRFVRTLKMHKWLAHPNIDFFKYTGRWLTASAAMILVGGALFATRGAANFDIDFTGGTMASLRFKTAMSTDQVRRIAGDVLTDVSVEEVRLSDDPTPGRRFVVRTTERDTAAPQTDAKTETVDASSVRRRLAAAFKDYLVLPSFEVVGEPTVIAAAPVAEAAKPAETKPADAKTEEAKPADAKAAEAKPEEAKPAEAKPAEVKTAGVPGDLAPFLGGKEVLVKLDEPRPATFLRAHLEESLRAAGFPNPEALFGLAPVGKAVVRQGAVGPEYPEYRLGTRGDLGKMLADLKTNLAASPEFDQFNQFGPQVAGDTKNQAVAAILLSWLGILIYVWFRFGSWSFGVAGIAALVHDVMVAVGMLALVSFLGANFPALNAVFISDMKINLNVVASLLTLIGYSINDKIVIFDRIREVRGPSHR